MDDGKANPSQPRLTDAINFLMFNNLGVSFDCGTSDVICRAIKLAWNDATMQGALNANIHSDSSETSNYSKTYKESFYTTWANSEQRTQLPALISGFDNANYNKWHLERCRSLVNSYNDPNNPDLFTYGNAQKWVNMTMKYLYVFASLAKAMPSNETCKEYLEVIGKRILDLAPYLHVPVDHFIINEAITELFAPLAKQKLDTTQYSNKELVERVTKTASKYFPLSNTNGNKQLWEYTDPSSRVVKWSKWNENDYRRFHDGFLQLLKKSGRNINPIDWEGPAWIRASLREQKRKKSRKTCLHESHQH